ncbi:hypothetical protein [Methanotorris igneus]|uniref:Energy-converting hydrogenase B, subunit J n=1 Tax=Methanotorris igneus (strain DSM 5666 / JCM 11834 / Kol 5) TaxID=880724 RepID=F6BA89_METIK|nr:hypothetical protein [Methanotorris igneus]AEF95779.1 hypothetical protein Metig_0222 [Methanotorris igneus Kol 5]
MDIGLYFAPIVGFLIGMVLGTKFREKIKVISFYLIVGAIIAYFLKPLPYYNFPVPLSLTYFLSVLGIIVGNLLFGGKWVE